MISQHQNKMSTHKKHIGKMFYEIRKQKKLSQDEVCKEAGISRPTLAGLESGEINTSIDVMASVANALNCTLEINLAKIT